MATQSNGFIVLGAIEEKWLASGGPGVFGHALSNEEPLGDKGRIQFFQNAWISWHPDPRIGAHIIKGAIAIRWDQLGRDLFGYPITDEGLAHDKRGWFNHFICLPKPGKIGNVLNKGRWGDASQENVEATPEPPHRSIYCHPDTGAYEVLDKIRDKWAETGWEHGLLGYPKGPEITLNDTGKLQLFQNGWICWHPDPGIGAHIIKGAIAVRWEQLGKDQFGYPITDEGIAADKKGKFNHFISLNLPDHPHRSIYWHGDTGAWEVIDAIRGKWAETGWEHGLLGYPKGSETFLNDTTGKLQLFQKGWISWHPDPGIGAHIIKGAIAVRWDQLGKDQFGYPITDEGIAADREGKFNHFISLNYPGHPHRSIYWHSDTGAWEVIDVIREKWAETGWEHGPLGYPNGQEKTQPDGTIRQLFQRGVISWRSDRSAGVDWVRKRGNIKTPPGTALGGWVELDIHWNGDYVFRGHLHDSGAADYKFQVQATLVTATTVVIMRKTGEVEGTFNANAARNFDWEERGVNKILSDHWPEMLNAQFAVTKSYEVSGAIASIVDSLKEALSFLIGIQILGPHIAVAILIGHELGAKADMRILGVGGFPATVITAGTSFLLGPGFAIPVFVGTSLLTTALYDGRVMTEKEHEFAKVIFGDSLPPAKRIIITNMNGIGGNAFVVPNGDGSFLLNIGKEAYDHQEGPMRFVKNSYPEPGQLFVHELVHVWQLVHTNFAPYFICFAVGTQLEHQYKKRVDNDHSTYYPPADPNAPWHEANSESQGSIVDKWYGTYSDVWLTLDDLRRNLQTVNAVSDPYYHHIANTIRLAIYNGPK